MAATPVRRRLSKDARRAELLRAGEKVFSERPVDEVSIDDIAAAAGISKNLLYHYFSGKRELYLAVISEACERMVELTEPDPDLEPTDRLHASLRAHLDYAEAHADGYTALLRGASSDADVLAIVTDAQDRVIARTLAGLGYAPGTAPAEMMLANRGWLGMIDSMTLEWLGRGCPPGKERMLELLADMFVGVLTAAATVAHRTPDPA